MDIDKKATNKIKGIFSKNGISIAEWARVNGFSGALVYQVLDGRRKCLRGQSHKIALALGLKEGQELTFQQLSKELQSRKEEDL